MKERLSSDNLYHFTKFVETLKKILRSGFRYGFIQERIPYKETYQENFAICFCDLRIEDTGTHRKRYGYNAIVLSKEWGIRYSVQPVTYVHENSSPISSKYVAMRNRWREIRQTNLRREELPQAMMDYLIFSKLLDDGKLKHELIENDIKANPNLGLDIQAAKSEFLEFVKTIDGIDPKAPFASYISSMFRRINDLHEELERRDSFTRIYKDPDSGRILYDEREWRAMKWCADIMKLPEAIRDRKLPESENLTFHDDDIVAILVENQKITEEIKEFIRTEQTLLHYEAVKDKIYCIDQFSERT